MNWLTIIRVPKNWEHPKKDGNFILDVGLDQYIDAMQVWLGMYQYWVLNNLEAHLEKIGNEDFIDFVGMPPDRENCITWQCPKYDLTCHQIYVTDLEDYIPFGPVFKNLDDMRAWLELNLFPQDVITELIETHRVARS